MKTGKNSFWRQPFVIIWGINLSVFSLFLLLTTGGVISALWLLIPFFLLSVALIDTFQPKHALRRNYPLAGRLRYILESIRPEMRQYFFEGELDGKPFSRRQRSIVYQRAKNVKQTVSFGMQDDPDRIGYEWAAHSIYPAIVKNDFRVLIGNRSCSQPYNASVLNIGAMSYGALSRTAVSSLNKGAALGGFAHNTGEGGISEYHLEGGDLIWQIGTGYFGCRDENGFFDEELFAGKAGHPQVKMIEIKLSQGAKPGHGGLLPSYKNTPEIAGIRNIQPYTTVHSPSAHTAFSNPLELVYFINRLRELSGGKPVGFKICIGRKDEFEEIVNQMAITGIMPDFIAIDGAEGGTGAAPLEFIDHMGMALTDALVFVNTTLNQYGIREEIRLLASGKIITAFDIARIISLGADACYSARGMMFSLGCIQALQCDSGKCPVGIATQNSSLYRGIDVSDKSVRVANFHKNTMIALKDFLEACGCSSLSGLRPDMFNRRIGYNENKNFQEIYYKTTFNRNNETNYNTV